MFFLVRFSFYPAPCIRALIELVSNNGKNHCIGQNCVCFDSKCQVNGNNECKLWHGDCLFRLHCIFQTVEIFGIYQEMDGD